MKLFFFLLLITSLDACGIAFIRLRKPLAYYEEKYGDPKWGLYKLMILMDRERNRGQDGAGIAVVNPNSEKPEIWVDHDLALDTLFSRFERSPAGTILLGHLRYSTSGGHELAQCHPFLHKGEDPNRSFALAGNFNLTNAATLLASNTSSSDVIAMLKTLVQSYEPSPLETLKKAAFLWDGGYVVSQIYANGDALICRDPFGIRPAFYYENEELFAVTSERFALMEAFGAAEEEIHPVPPGYALLFPRSGDFEMAPFSSSPSEKSCVFERIYFSKGNDSEIYQERKKLGRQLAPKVFEAIQGDLAHTIFTYVPNSSQSAYLGLIDEIDRLHRQRIEEKLLAAAPLPEIQALVRQQIRNEMLIVKNQKVRTFISSDQTRNKWVSHLYETTRSVVAPTDTLVVIDDSIVRGVTLKESLMQRLIELNPKKIIIVSSAPPVCYPDCYGIDMSQLGRYVAFQAATELYYEKQGHLPTDLSQVYTASLSEIEAKVAQLITPEETKWKGEVVVIYQSLEGLHQAIPTSHGDWVFSGHYPTPGGYKVLETSFNNWLKKDDSRSY